MRTNMMVSIFCLDDIEENFVLKGVYPAWVHHESRIRKQGNGAELCDTFDVRISKEKLDEVCSGDLIFFGDAQKTEADTSKCRRIAAVRENNVGFFPHWHLRAEYMYR